MACSSRSMPRIEEGEWRWECHQLDKTSWQRENRYSGYNGSRVEMEEENW